MVRAEKIVGDDGQVAERIRSAGLAAEKLPAPYTLEDVLSTPARRRSALRRPLPRPQFGRTTRIALAGVILLLAVLVPLVVRRDANNTDQPATPGGAFEAAPSLLPATSSLEGVTVVTPGTADFSSSGAPQRLLVVSAESGSYGFVQPFSANTNETGNWVPAGDLLVTVNNLQTTNAQTQVGNVQAFSPADPGRVISLGRASYVVNAETAGAAWLVTGPVISLGTAPTRCTVEEVALTGHVLLPDRPFPCTWTIDGPAPGGLVVTEGVAPGGSSPGLSVLGTWDPNHDVAPRSIGRATHLSVYSDEGTTLLWDECNSSPSSCQPELTDLQNGRTMTLPDLAARWRADSTYVLDPSGRFVAIVVAGRGADAPSLAESCCYRDLKAIASDILLYDTGTDSLVEARPLTAGSEAHIAWPASGGYVILTRDRDSIEAVPLWSDSAPIRIITIPKEAMTLAPSGYMTETFMVVTS